MSAHEEAKRRDRLWEQARIDQERYNFANLPMQHDTIAVPAILNALLLIAAELRAIEWRLGDRA